MWQHGKLKELQSILIKQIWSSGRFLFQKDDNTKTVEFGNSKFDQGLEKIRQLKSSKSNIIEVVH